MKVAVSEFKAKCTQFLHAVEEGKESVEVTRRGKVIAIVSSSESGRQDPGYLWAACKAISLLHLIGMNHLVKVIGMPVIEIFA